MRKSVFAAVVLTVLGSIGATAGAGLLESIPAGQDVYIVFDPDGAGLDRFLQVVRETPVAGELAEVREAIGFNPLDWDEWVSALSLEPGMEIGFVIDAGPHDVSTVSIYLPTTSETDVRRFFDSFTGPESGFRGVLRYCTSDDYIAVIMAENEETAGRYDPDGPGLAEDETYRNLASESVDGTPVGSVYIRFADLLGNRDVESGLLRATTDGPNLTVGISTRLRNPEVLRITDVLSPGAGDADFHVAEGTEGTIRANFDMQTLARILDEEGIVREFSMGIEEMGLESFTDFLDMFTGDVLFTIESDQMQYNAALQFGLDDREAMQDLLTSIMSMASESDGPFISEFDCDGNTCYSVEAAVAPGIGYIEYGVLQGALVIAGGSGIRETAAGSGYGSFTDETSPGVDTDAGLVATVAPELLKDILGMEDELPWMVQDLYGSLGSMSASLVAEDGRFDLVLTIEATDGDPVSLITGLLTTVGLGMLLGIMVRQNF